MSLLEAAAARPGPSSLLGASQIGSSKRAGPGELEAMAIGVLVSSAPSPAAFPVAAPNSTSRPPFLVACSTHFYDALGLTVKHAAISQVSGW